MDEEVVQQEQIVEDKKQTSSMFVETFASQLEKEQYRLTSEPSETAAARRIRDIISSVNKDFNAKLEPFYARPFLGRRSFMFMAVWLFICDILYFVSFQKNVVAAIVLTLVAMLMFMGGMGIIFAMYLGEDRLSFFLPKKACYNVETEFTTPYKYSVKSNENTEPNNTIVLCANHDSLPGMYFEDRGIFKKFALIYTPIFMIIFILMCIIKMGVGNDTVGKIVALSLIPGLLSIVAMFVFIAHYSIFPAHARENNCISPSIALAVFVTLYGQRNYLPENTRIVYVSFGGENSGHGGSKAFVERHLARDRGFANAKVICLEEVNSGSIMVSKEDIIRRIRYSEDIRAKLEKVGQENGIELKDEKIFGAIHGHIANSFQKQGIQAISLYGKDESKNNPVPLNSEAIQKLFDLTLGTVKDILKEDKTSF